MKSWHLRLKDPLQKAKESENIFPSTCTESLKELKPKTGNMKKNKQYAYSGIWSVINNVKKQNSTRDIQKL